MVVELDFDRISCNCSGGTPENIPNDTIIVDLVDEEDFLGGELVRYHSEDVGIEQGTQIEEQNNVPTPQQSGTSACVSLPGHEPDHDPEHLRKTLLQCIKPYLIPQSEDIINNMYETREIDGGKLRVNRLVSAAPESNLENTVHAVHGSAGWRCQVPRCGAVFDRELTTDLHVEYHGAPEITK